MLLSAKFIKVYLEKRHFHDKCIYKFLFYAEVDSFITFTTHLDLHLPLVIQFNSFCWVHKATTSSIELCNLRSKNLSWFFRGSQTEAHCLMTHIYMNSQFIHDMNLPNTSISFMLVTPTKIMKLHSPIWPICQKLARVFKWTGNMFHSSRKAISTKDFMFTGCTLSEL